MKAVVRTFEISENREGRVLLANGGAGAVAARQSRLRVAEGCYMRLQLIGAVFFRNLGRSQDKVRISHCPALQTTDTSLGCRSQGPEQY